MVKNIIFDIGGVILNIDYALTIDAFKRLGVADFDALYSQAQQDSLFDDLETGRITPEKFRKGLRELTGLEVDDRALDRAWNAMLLDVPRERVELLKQVGMQKRIFLLSNTNQIHISTFLEHVNERFGDGYFADLFENIYYSHKIGMRKPDAEVFEHVLRENKMLARETAFIDDSKQHVEGAKAVGITGVLHGKWQSFEATVNELLRL